MKQQLSFLATALLLAVAPPPSRAETAITVDFFYDALADQGDWIEVADYGYCWQPRDVDKDWRPYTVGSWVYTDAGWTWVSEEPHGWATHHYGRWINVEDTGWAWVPDVEWGPAWVSWRRSEQHVGWAPLPPEARFERTVGISTWADSYYDIGPTNYSFVETRNMGAPHLRTVLIEPRQNLTIINETRNITKITYVNNVVMNEGPEYDAVLRVSAQPIRRLTLRREVAVGGDLEAVRGGRFASRVEGDSLQVVAPAVQITNVSAPKNVVKKVTNITVNKGWKNAGPPEQVEKLRAKTKAEAPPPAQLPPQPKFQPIARRGGGGRNAETSAAATAPDAPAPAATGAPAAAPMKDGKGAKKAGQPVAAEGKPAHPTAPDQPGAKTATPGEPDAAAPPTDPTMKKGARPGRPGMDPRTPGGKRPGKNQPGAPAAEDTPGKPSGPVTGDPTRGAASPDAAPANTAPDATGTPEAGEAKPRRGMNAPGAKPGRANRPGQHGAGAPDADPAAGAPASPDASPAAGEGKPARNPGAAPGTRPGRGNRPDGAAPGADPTPAAAAPDSPARTGAGGGGGKARRNGEADGGAGRPDAAGAPGGPRREPGQGAGPGGERPEGAGRRKTKPGKPGVADDAAAEEKRPGAAQ